MHKLILLCVWIPSVAFAALPDIVPRPQGVIYKGTGSGFTITDETRVAFGSDPRSDDLILPLTRALRAAGVQPRFHPTSDDPAGGNLIAVGTRGSRAVDRLCRERGLDASADYPGPEGYVIDVAPDGIVVAGSDTAGAFYGVLTLAQMIEKGKGAAVEGVTIYDRPDLRMRILFMMKNLLVDKNVDDAVALIQRATDCKMNRLFLSDFKFWLLDDMTNRYFDNVERVKSATRRGFMEIIPDVSGLGRSEGVLRHNRDLAEGYPVTDAPFVAVGDTAAFLPDRRVSLPNGDFEDAVGDRFSGWTWQESPGVTTFADAQTVYSGRQSCRMENFRANAPHGNSRFYREMEVIPHRNYYFSIYVKTKDLVSGAGATTAVIGIQPDGNTRELNYAAYDFNGTHDWTRLEANFNSLNCARVRCYLGVWGGGSGTAWFDRAEVREIALVNVLRREGTPLTVTSKDRVVTYTERVDYAPVVDPKLGMQPYAGNYDKYHAPPALRILPSGAIRRGDTLLVSFYHPVVIYESQVAYCVSEEETYRIYEKALRNTCALFRPRMMSIGHDEIRHMNHDRSCLRRGMTPAHLLAGDLARLREIVRAVDPQIQVSIWSDMLDAFHNARDRYYLVNGDLTGAADLVPKDLVIGDWNREKMQESVDFFVSKGFPVFVSNDAGSTLSATLDWSEAARRKAGGLGEMFTTWTQNYDNLETVADYMWSLSPYIDLIEGERRKTEGGSQKVEDKGQKTKTEPFSPFALRPSPFTFRSRRGLRHDGPSPDLGGRQDRCRGPLHVGGRDGRLAEDADGPRRRLDLPGVPAVRERRLLHPGGGQPGKRQDVPARRPQALPRLRPAPGPAPAGDAADRSGPPGLRRGREGGFRGFFSVRRCVRGDERSGGFHERQVRPERGRPGRL